MAKSRGRKFAEITSPTSGVFDLTSVPTITNAKLQNSAMTLAGSSVSLGGTGVADTDALSEGSSNLYFTNARVQSFLGGGTLAGNIVVPDNRSIYLGSNSDFRLVHNTTNTQLINATGALQVTSNGGFDVTGAATFSSTVAVTGTLSSGDVTISSTAGTLTLVDSDGTQQNTIIKQSGGNVFIQARDNTNNAGIVFGGNGGGSFDEHMRILPSGNVGIGEDTPTAPLHIDAAGMGDIYSGRIENTTTDTDHYNVVRWFQGASGSAIGMIGTGGSATSNTAFRNTFVVGTQNSTDLVFATNDTERVRIDASTGNVTAPNLINIATDSTIQTTSARQWATIKNTGTGTGDYSEMKISNDNNDYLVMGSIGSGYNGADWSSSSYIYANRELRIKSLQGIRFFVGGFTIGSDDDMILEQAGNLGIGITSGISSRLHVNAEMSLGPDGNNRGIIGYGSNILSLGTRQSSTNYFSTVKITSGTVGIGQTPTGSHMLEITKVGGDGINVNSGADFGGIRLTDNNHSYAIRNASNNFFIYDVTNTTQRVTLSDTGRFGIGISPPTSLLDVVSTEATWTGKFRNYATNSYGVSIDLSGSNASNIYALAVYTPANTGFFVDKNNRIGIGKNDNTFTDLFLSHAGSGWRTTHGSTNLYVKYSGGTYDPQFYYGAPQGIVVSVDSSNTTGPDKTGLTLYNNDNTAGGFSPMLVFAKSESGTSPYKATMAAIYARAPTGTGNNTSWIDGDLSFATAGAATQGAREVVRFTNSSNIIQKGGTAQYVESGDFCSYNILPYLCSSGTTDKGILQLASSVSSGTGTAYVAIENSGQNVVWGYIIDFFFSNNSFSTNIRANGNSQNTTTPSMYVDASRNVYLRIVYAGGLGGNIKVAVGGHVICMNY